MRVGDALLDEPWVDLRRAWSETSWRMRSMRDDPQSADEEYEAQTSPEDPGLSVSLSFDPEDDIAAPYIARGVRPAVAILREQGVNSQVETAAVFERAGFVAHDVHMTDLLSGRRSLREFKGLVACGGFSYGDVLGAGRGLGQVDSVPRAGARGVPGVLRAPGHLLPGYLQRLPDVRGSQEPDSRHRSLAPVRHAI